MTAYLIAIRNSTSDAEGLAAYNAAAGQTFVDGMQVLARGSARAEALEGPPLEGVVIVKFDDFESAKAWYEGPGYQKAREHRLPAADYRFILVEGL